MTSSATNVGKGDINRNSVPKTDVEVDQTAETGIAGGLHHIPQVALVAPVDHLQVILKENIRDPPHPQADPEKKRVITVINNYRLITYY